MLLLLLDADVIIGLHKFGLWHEIIKNHKVYIPSIILRKEVYYYEDEKGDRIPINLIGDTGEKFHELSCTADELIEFAEEFDSAFQHEIHEGEKEALILLRKQEEFSLCTCDQAAIKTLGLLDLSHQGISFENLLKKTGMNKKLAYKFTEKCFKKCLSEGTIMKIQNKGLKGKAKK